MSDARQDLKPTIRVAGLLIHEGSILRVEQGRGDERYWLLPGGGVKFGETLQDGLRREFQEELGMRVGVQRLVAIVESTRPRSAPQCVGPASFGTRDNLRYVKLAMGRSPRAPRPTPPPRSRRTLESRLDASVHPCQFPRTPSLTCCQALGLR